MSAKESKESIIPKHPFVFSPEERDKVTITVLL